MPTKDNYLSIKSRVDSIAKQYGRNPDDITIVTVSKGHPWPVSVPIYQAGCRNFAENRVQEALPKMEHAPDDIQWHMIGTLQKNKVKDVIGSFYLIHSVDTPELATKIAGLSQNAGLVTDILLQINSSGETTKHGLSPEAWKRNIEALMGLSGIRMCGLMTIAALTDKKEHIRESFQKVRILRDELAPIVGKDFSHLSMGMTNDYEIAIAEGATLLRLGSAIYG